MKLEPRATAAGVRLIAHEVLGSTNAKVRAREMRTLVEAGFTAVNSKGKAKVSDLLVRKSSKDTHAAKKKTTGESNAS